MLRIIQGNIGNVKTINLLRPKLVSKSIIPLSYHKWGQYAHIDLNRNKGSGNSLHPFWAEFVYIDGNLTYRNQVTIVEFKPVASPIINLEAKRSLRLGIKLRSSPMDPNRSVKIIDVFRLIMVYNQTVNIAPIPAPKGTAALLCR